MDKRELVETLITLLDDQELQSIVDKVIKEKQTQLSKLQQLSMKLSIKPDSSVVSVPVHYSEEITAPEAVLRIMREAGKPLSNSEIRKRYSELYGGKELKANTLGNVLWKGKQENIYKKLDSRGSRYTKWVYIGSENDEE